MKKIRLITACMLCGFFATSYDSPVLPVEQLAPLKTGNRILSSFPRKQIELPKSWKHSFAEMNGGEWCKPEFDDSAWSDFPVPFNWFEKHPERCKADTAVQGRYRVKIAPPQYAPQDRLLLRIEQAGTEKRLYVNGREAGFHGGNFTPMAVDITDDIAAKQPITLGVEVSTVVREKNMRYAAGCSWGVRSEKGGIWGNVTLETRPAVYIEKSFIDPFPKTKTIEVRAEIVNTTGGTVKKHLISAVRSAMADDQQRLPDCFEKELTLSPGVNLIKFTIPLASPTLWEPENPYLYYLDTALYSGTDLTDRAVERFGMRSFEIIGKEFRLNGNRIYLFGGNLLSVNYGGFGRNDRERLLRELQRLKSEGYNILRTPHQPIITEAFELADELGMLIMNEWAWGFSRPLVEDVFAENSKREVREWMRRDYNYPSNVMYSCGNEVFIRDKQHDFRRDLFNALVRQLKSEDTSGRPVSVMDGCDDYYGTAGLETDLFSFHQYAGLSRQPWSMVRETVMAQREKSVSRLQTQLDKPVILFECVGFSWNPPYRLYTREPLTVERYLELAKQPSSWGAPQAAGGIGVTGMQLWLHPDFQLHHARNLLGKRILETYRLMPDEIQGFSPWFMEAPAENAVIWNAPLQSILDNYTLHPISGQAFGGTLHLLNDQHWQVNEIEQDFVFFRRSGSPPFQARYTEPGDAEIIWRTTIKQNSLQGFERRRQTLTIPTPSHLKAGHCLLNISTRGKRVDGKEISSVNFYEIFIQNPVDLKPLTSPAAIGLPPGFVTGRKLLEPILSQLEIPFQEVKNATELKGIGVLLIPPAEKAEQLPFTTRELLNFVKQGGRFACLEQQAMIPLPGQLLPLLYDEQPNALVDLVRPGHPVFDGLHQQQFDGWDGGEFRLINRYAVPCFDSSLLAASGKRYEQNTLRAAMLEYRYGKGAILYNQLDAFRRFGKDAAASRFCRNLLAYLTTMAPAGGLPELPEVDAAAIQAVPDAIPVSLDSAANRTLVEFLGKGDNNLAALPCGKNNFGGVPFVIPASGKAVVVAGGSAPHQAQSVKIGRHASALLFLHGAADGKPGQIGSYLIHYADKKTIEVPLKNGVEIGDWWNPVDLQEAVTVWRNHQQTTDADGETLWTLGGEAGVYLYCWYNPREQVAIESVTLKAEASSTVFLAGLSLAPERGATAFTPSARAKINPDNGRDEKLPQISTQEILPGVPGHLCKMLEDGSYPAGFCFFYFENVAPPRAERLSFLVRNHSEAGISLRFTLPEKRWRKVLKRTVYLEPGAMRRVEFDLTGELTIDQLRHELMISNGSPHVSTFTIGSFTFH